jgi:type I restriction enzyme S subunit
MNLLRLRCVSEVDSSYIFYAFQNLAIRQQIWDRAQHAVNQASVNIKQLSAVLVPVAPLAEQKKIVEILEEQLSRLDAALALVRAVREKSARFRRSLLHAAFTGALTGHDTTTGALPSGWYEEQLGELADVGWGDLQVTKSSFISNGFIAYSAAGPDGFREGFDFDQDGIVLSAIGAGCGRTWYAKGRWSCIKNTIRILEKSKDVRLDFLYQQLSDPNAWPKRGSGQPFISQKDARELMVKVPPMSEQARIVQILEEQLSRLDASLTIADAIEKKASALRRSLLHAAFTGNLTKEWREGAHV